ncbi:MAG: FAD binding domain-containing protein [Roseomonas sp.]|nr:FAD binding domain-containing protein [Roseomonas sp.]
MFIAFTLNGALRRLPAETPPAMTLLDWLRAAGLTGTKEGCAEGDCGACTVVIEAPDGARAPVNACLMTLGQAHGLAIRSVEGLSAPDGAPHPVQVAMLAAEATQCGFCTPGIVMSLYAHARMGGDAHEALAGNLCRCTGYRPILDAMAALPAAEDAAPSCPATDVTALGPPEHRFFLPRSLDETLALRRDHPGAWILAGGTDLGLRFSEHRENPGAIICLRDVAELRGMTAGPEGLSVGAAEPYAALLDHMAHDADFAAFAGLLRRLGSRQIRALGTLGGNLGTASPIGDALPPLLALGARVSLAGPDGARDVAVEDFLLGYRRNALGADEVIARVFIPRPAPGAIFAAEKLSRRHDQDISAIGLAVLLERDGDVITRARIAHGGCGPMAARAPEAEAVLEGAPFTQAQARAAGEALARAITPMDDLRGTAEYRRVAARNLLLRLYWREARPDAAAEIMALPTPHAPRFIAP